MIALYNKASLIDKAELFLSELELSSRNLQLLKSPSKVWHIFCISYIMNHATKVICLESAALYQLVDKVVERIKDRKQVVQDKWLSPEEAMSILRITSKTTLQKLRDNDEIRVSKLSAKKVLYDRDSLYDYLERHSKNAS